MEALRSWFSYDGLLSLTLQEDQLTVINYLHQGCISSSKTPENWDRLQQCVYPSLYLVAASFAALKDVVLYPLQGCLRMCSILLSGNFYEIGKGLREILFAPIKTLALSIYLLGLSVLGLFVSKSIYAAIDADVEELISNFSRFKMMHKENPFQRTLLDWAALPYAGWNSLSETELDLLIKLTRKLLAVLQMLQANKHSSTPRKENRKSIDQFRGALNAELLARMSQRNL